MTIGRPAVAIASGDELGESATWSAREAALYWVDVRGPTLHRFDPATKEYRNWPLPDLCGGVVPMMSGVALALGHRLAHFDPASAAITHLCDIEPVALGNRLNEARCDPSGRLWIGSMRDLAVATTGSLYRIDAGLTPERVLTGITIPNGLAWSPDGRAMYFADTGDGRLRAYDYDVAAGRVGEMRVLVDADALPGRPDGAAVDSDGHVWITRVGGGCVVRMAPDGTAGDVIRLPVTQPTSCAFGGLDLCTLYITTARQRLDPTQRRAQPDAGHLFAVRVDVAGMRATEFAAAVPATGGRATPTYA